MPWVEGVDAVARVVAMGMSLLVVGMGEGPDCNGGKHGGGAVLRLERMAVACDGEGVWRQ